MLAASLEKARFNMVHQQIRPWEVVDPRIIKVLETLSRDAFVPAAYKNLAYSDIEIVIGEGQTMMAPKIEARLLQALNIQPEDKVLEIGTGSGYLTACLAALGERVVSLEINETLCNQARERLAALNVNNVEVRCEDGLQLVEEAAYDAIAVTGSLPVMAEGLKRLLKVGGRMFVVTGEGKGEAMQASLITRVNDDAWRTEILFETTLPPLANAPQPERFTF